jgi:heme-degrading monooxygenase HmoA
MYVNVAKGRLQPDKTEEAIELWRNTLLPELRQHEGFRGLLVMGERQTGEGLSITLWETEEDFRATASERGYQQTFSQIGPLYCGLLQFSTYELFFHEHG